MQYIYFWHLVFSFALQPDKFWWHRSAFLANFLLDWKRGLCKMSISACDSFFSLFACYVFVFVCLFVHMPIYCTIIHTYIPYLPNNNNTSTCQPVLKRLKTQNADASWATFMQDWCKHNLIQMCIVPWCHDVFSCLFLSSLIRRHAQPFMLWISEISSGQRHGLWWVMAQINWLVEYLL